MVARMTLEKSANFRGWDERDMKLLLSLKGLYRGSTGITGKKMETAIQCSEFEGLCFRFEICMDVLLILYRVQESAIEF